MEAPKKKKKKDYPLCIRVETSDVERAKKLGIDIPEACRLAIKKAIELASG